MLGEVYHYRDFHQGYKCGPYNGVFTCRALCPPLIPNTLVDNQILQALMATPLWKATKRFFDTLNKIERKLNDSND